VLPLLEELGIGFVAYSPLGRGFLAGAFSGHGGFSDDDFRRTHPRFQPEALQRNAALVEALTQIGSPRGLTPAQLALAWLLSRRPWIVPIPGTRRRSRLDENLQAAHIALTAEELQRIEQAVADHPIQEQRYAARELSMVDR
jgi:aryl-alcohol dehydrogenase-like predicted oxidoreductase